MINKNLKRKIFDRAASTYDAHAVLQNQIIDNLFERLDLIKIKPSFALELGCGTGRTTPLLQKKFNNLNLFNYDISEGMLEFAKSKNSLGLFSLISSKKNYYICGDIDYLPFKEEVFDLIWSSSTLQWSNNFDKSLSQVLNLLKPGGLFIFSTYGPNTLMELGSITEEIFQRSTLNYFYDVHDIGDLLINLGFKDPVLDVENFTLTYEDPKNLLIDLKKIGATSGPEIKDSIFLGKSFIQQYKEGYEKFKENNLCPATYEVIYGHAWKSIMTEGQHPIKFK